jgi:protein TonB
VVSLPTNKPLANLEITLVKQQTEQAPEQADFLAQANNEGGGETDDKSPEPTPQTIDNPSSQLEPTPAQSEQPTPELIKEPEPTIEPVKTIKKPPAKQIRIITQTTAERKVETTIETDDKSDTVIEVIPKPKLSAQNLMLQTRNEISELERKLNESTQKLSNWPKKRILSPKTKEYAAAAYHEAWIKKVERIGNLNYPQEAKRKKIKGRLTLSVDILPDGSVPSDGIIITRRSGYKVLDAAAVKIVRLGSPYAAIPENVLQNFDMITITRTWRFETDQGLRTK